MTNETNTQSNLVAIYCRVSSEKQEKENTIDSQIAEVEKKVKENGDEIIERYLDDGYSGELLWERPALDKLRNEAPTAKWKKLYVLAPDRLARKSYYAAVIVEELGKHGIGIVFVNRPIGDSIEDRLLFDVQSVFADYEKAKILDRMMRGKLHKAKKGVIMGNTPPFGYDYIKDEVRGGRYEINKEEAEVVKLIYELYATGNYSIFKIAKELNARGLKSKKWSNRWPTTSLCRILGNETYCGTTHWGKNRSVEAQNKKGKYKRLKNEARVRRPKGEWYAIQVPVIITRELFEKVQAVKASSKYLSDHTKHEYLLRGLMNCSICNSRYYCTSTTGRYYYFCGHKKRAYPYHEDVECHNKAYIPVIKFDDAVWESFCKILQSPALLKEIVDGRRQSASVEQIEEELKKIKQKVETLEIKKKRLLIAYTEQAITLTEYRKLKGEIDTEMNDLQIQLASKEAMLDRSAYEDVNAEKVGQILKEKVQGLKFEEKIYLTRLFLRGVTSDGNLANVYATLPISLMRGDDTVFNKEHTTLVNQPSQWRVS